VHCVAAIVFADRLDPVGAVIAQVCRGQGAAAFACECRDLLGNLTFVISTRTLLGKLAQRAGVSGKTHQFAHLRRPAARHEGLRKARQVFQFGHSRRPFVGHDACDCVAALGDLNGRLHKIGKRQ
jgi:hypothetical protein